MDTKKEQVEANVLPAIIGKVSGGGSFEEFKEALRNALISQFGGANTYLYIIGTYRTKVCISVETKGKSKYFEIPYEVKNGSFSFGTPVEVVKVTKFMKADQKIWTDYQSRVKDFVNGKDLGDAVQTATELKRSSLCLVKS